jgi:flagellar basal body-associated protein FliL
MGTLILVLLAVLLTVGGNAAVYMFLRPKAGPAEAAKVVVVESSVKSMMHLETFVVNLPDPEHHSYLRIGIELGLNKEEKEKKEGEKPEAGASGPVPEIRDTIISVLSESKPEDLVTAEGKKALKELLVKKLREKLPELGVQEVYFTEFLMQH